MRKHFLSLFALLISAQFTFAVSQSDYSSINNTSGTTLRNNLYTITSTGPTGMSYDGLWTAYKTTDVYPTGHAKAGKIWDMYSDCTFTYSTDQCGNYSNVCDCYNREHSLPKSWFNDKTPAYYDLGHIVPTDGKVNGMRSNDVFGECASGYATWGTGKLGSAKSITTTNTINGTITTTFTGTAFEPSDDYKGDFARMYMYMIVRYKKGNSNSITFTATSDGQVMFNNTDENYGLTNYSIALLMKWHRQDRVSQKEIDRNNGMQTKQGNRNPFIDYPILAEYLWGDKAGQTFTFDAAVGSFESEFIPGESDGSKNTTTPAITSPKGTIDLGATNTEDANTLDVNVKGINLTSGNLTLSLSGSNYFSLATNSVSQAQALNGYNVTITYAPQTEGSHTATLTITGCGVTNHQVTLTGTCTAVHTITWSSVGLTQYTTAATNTIPPLPATTPANCSDDRVFVGWTETAGYTGDTEPTDLFTTPSAITGPKTFYAVYADVTTSGTGSTGNVTITTSTANIPTSYGTANTFTEYTFEGYKFKVQQMYLNNGKLQWRASGNSNGTGTMYNTETFPGKLSSIVLTYNSSDGNKNFTVKVGSSQNPTEGTSITPTSSGNVYTFDCSGQNADYFVMANGTGAGYLDQIVINYSGGSTSYSNYSTVCTACEPVAATAYYDYEFSTAPTCGSVVANGFHTNSNAEITYTSNNENVATVAADGTVTAVGAGSAKITATVAANTCYTGGASASYTLTVASISPFTIFDSPTTTLVEGSSVTNTVVSASTGAVTYSSSDISVATVDATTGEVTGVSAGTATITASVAPVACFAAGSAYYDIEVTALPTYIVTFINNGTTFLTQTGHAGEAISGLGTPTLTDCEDYTFEGWSTEELAQDNTVAPTTVTPTTIPEGDATYYAVYTKTETTGGGGGGSTTTTVSMNSFSDISGNVGGDENVSFEAAKGNAGTAPAVYSGVLRIYQNGGLLTITANNGKKLTSITIGSSMATSVSYAVDGGDASSSQSIEANGTFTLNNINATSVVFTCTGADKNHRLYLNSLSVTYSGSGGGGTTTVYHTTAPDCTPCTVTITILSADETMGSVEFVE